MPKKLGVILMTMGAVLMLSALLLFGYNSRQARLAGQEAELLLGGVRQAMAAPQAEPEELTKELPVVEIEGYGYIGSLSIPALGLELPVMAEWDYTRLKISPCRQAGSSRSDDLVIAAHNYKTHFGKLSGLEEGAEILFTDMDGILNRYSLAKLETVDPNDVMAVLASEYDLVLYTCTGSGAARVAAFCRRQTP